MMSRTGIDIMLIEELTNIIAQQSLIISRLYCAVLQLDAAIDFDDEIEKIQEKAREAIGEP